MCDKIIQNLIACAEDYDAETIRCGGDPADTPHEIEVIDGDEEWTIKNKLTGVELQVTHGGAIFLRHTDSGMVAFLGLSDAYAEALLNWGKCSMGMTLRAMIDDMVQEQEEAADWQ